MPDVTDFPIWADCPFKDKIPASIEIRKGRVGEQEIETLWWPEKGLHVDCSGGSLERALEPALANLAGAAFEQEFPDIFIPMIRAQAKTVAHGDDFPVQYRKALARYIEIEQTITGRELTVHKNFLASLPVLH